MEIDTKKAERFIAEATVLYADIVFGVFNAKKYDRMRLEYSDVDRYDILGELFALTKTPIDGRKWRRLRNRIDSKGTRYKALVERCTHDVV